jgi:hypothetical protein
VGWEKTAADRKADAAFYSDPVYKRHREIAKRRAAGRCEECGHRHPTQCDHVIPRIKGGTHALDNLRMLCAGDGTCKCHERKTAGEGGGWRKTGDSRVPRDPQPRPRTKWLLLRVIAGNDERAAKQTQQNIGRQLCITMQ